MAAFTNPNDREILPGVLRAPWIAVFREIIAQIRASQYLECVKTWRVWDGAIADIQGWSTGNVPGIELFPAAAPSSFVAVDQMAGWMQLSVEIAVAGPRPDDAHDLWYTLLKALYPESLATRLEYQRNLRDVLLPYGGARTGLASARASFVVAPPNGDGITIGRGVLPIEAALNIDP